MPDEVRDPIHDRMNAGDELKMLGAARSFAYENHDEGGRNEGECEDDAYGYKKIDA